MNDELKAKVIGYLDRMDAAAQKVGAFAETEVPEAIREWLLWLAVERFTYAVAFLAIAGLFVLLYRAATAAVRSMVKENEAAKAEKKAKPHDDDTIGFGYAFRVIFLILVLLSLAGAGRCALRGAKVIVAPRVVLIEEVANLVRSEK